MFYCELLSGIWISDIEIMNNSHFIKDKNITIVLNCTQIYDFPDIDIQKIRLPFSPHQNNDDNLRLLKNNYVQIVEYIQENIDTNNILISCYDGKSISALISALYMIHYGGISKDNIRDILRSKNESICLDFDLSIF